MYVCANIFSTLNKDNVMSDITLTKTYIETLNDIKKKIKTAQIKAHFSVNMEVFLCLK